MSKRKEGKEPDYRLYLYNSWPTMLLLVFLVVSVTIFEPNPTTVSRVATGVVFVLLVAYMFFFVNYTRTAKGDQVIELKKEGKSGVKSSVPSGRQSRGKNRSDEPSSDLDSSVTLLDLSDGASTHTSSRGHHHHHHDNDSSPGHVGHHSSGHESSGGWGGDSGGGDSGGGSSD